MPRVRTAATALILLALAAPGAASGAYRATRPSPHPLYHNGQSGRFLLDGAWLFQLDPPGGGLLHHLQRSTSPTGWSSVSVPYTWNAHDDSAASFTGGVAWYRKDFKLPDRHAGEAWIARFESINYRARVWLNGSPLGGHIGEFLPFELPLRHLRSGTNRLVVRVDSRHTPTDFPPGRLASDGSLSGGWWNEGGLNREVYLRRVRTVDLAQVQVSPRLPCPRCSATIKISALLSSYASHAAHVSLSASYGSVHRSLGTVVVPARGSRTVNGQLRLRHPRLWGPGHPYLYPAVVRASVGGKVVASYSLRSGVRSLKVTSSGRLLLNGQAIHFRGVGLHEDSPTTGWAIRPAFERAVMAEVRSAGATEIRAHYPLNPYFEELADRYGVLLWSEVPVYEMRIDDIGNPTVRLAAVDMVRENILANGNHPSIAVWSIANELASHVNRRQASYIAAAAKEAHSLDPTRPVGLAVAGYLNVGCQLGYGPLDLVGFNEYFGWYTGPGGSIADRDELSGYLDHVRACYPHKAIVVTEFGAEANRAGPVEEKGTYANQQAFVRFHLGVFATKPWLTGANYWVLREFRVRPDWNGGNPRPTVPLHQKGLFSFAGVAKPAFYDLERLYRSVRQYGGRL